MSISLRQVRYICTVADRGSIQGACRELHISASSVLAAIESAETSLGSRMFDRRRSTGIAVTPDGERFVEAGRHLLAAESDFQRQIGALRSETRSIRIGCFEPFGALFMTEGLTRFIQAVGPVEISLFEGDQTQLADWLDRGIVDLVISYDIGPRFNAHITPICSVPAHVLMPCDHPLAGSVSLTIPAIEPYSVVLLDLPLTVSYLLSLYDLHGIKPTVGFRTRSYDTVRSAVADGFGLAILNMRPISGNNADSPRLLRVPLGDGLPAPTLQIADLYGSAKPCNVQRLVDIFVALFRDGDPARFAVATPERLRTVLDV